MCQFLSYFIVRRVKGLGVFYDCDLMHVYAFQNLTMTTSDGEGNDEILEPQLKEQTEPDAMTCKRHQDPDKTRPKTSSSSDAASFSFASSK